MCLSPNIILNPNYSQHRHEFRYLSLASRIIEQKKLSDGTYFPENLPPFSSFGLCPDNLSLFIAVSDEGEVVPIFMAVPCGKCLECIESKRSQIRVRMYLEQMSHDVPPIFVTLTYNNENLPADGVSREDVKKFLNRFHLYLGRAGRSTYFRHVFFSEYGSKNGRPHYHGIIFGHAVEDTYKDKMEFFDILEKAWGKGYVRFDIVHSRAFGYVSKYIGKDSFLDTRVGRNPNFWTASRRDGGLGSRIVTTDAFLELCSTPHFPTVNLPCEGRLYTVTLPAYIRDKVLPPLRKYISREIRDAYIQFKKDLCLLKCIDFNLCQFHTVWPCPELRFTDVAEDFRDYSRSPKCIAHDECAKYARQVVEELSPIVEKYDYLLGFYYGSDEYWKTQFEHLPWCFDYNKLYTRLYRNAEILSSVSLDVPYLLTQISIRDRVSRRFVARVKKHLEELPPDEERERILLSKNIRDFQNRFKDLQ